MMSVTHQHSGKSLGRRTQKGSLGTHNPKAPSYQRSADPGEVSGVCKADRL